MFASVECWVTMYPSCFMHLSRYYVNLFNISIYPCSCSWGCFPVCLVLVASSSSVGGSWTLHSHIWPMMHMAKFISLLTHPRTFSIPMDSKLQEEVAIWYQISSLCGPHSLHVSLCSISTLIFPCIYLFSSFIKYLCHSNVQTSYIVPLFPNPKASTPNLWKLNPVID